MMCSALGDGTRKIVTKHMHDEVHRGGLIIVDENLERGDLAKAALSAAEISPVQAAPQETCGALYPTGEAGRSREASQEFRTSSGMRSRELQPSCWSSCGDRRYVAGLQVLALMQGVCGHRNRDHMGLVAEPGEGNLEWRGGVGGRHGGKRLVCDAVCPAQTANRRSGEISWR